MKQLREGQCIKSIRFRAIHPKYGISVGFFLMDKRIRSIGLCFPFAKNSDLADGAFVSLDIVEREAVIILEDVSFGFGPMDKPDWPGRFSEEEGKTTHRRVFERDLRDHNWFYLNMARQRCGHDYTWQFEDKVNA